MRKDCIVLYCIVLYCIVLYCIVLYCIVLYCIVLYCIVDRYLSDTPNNVELYCIQSDTAGGNHLSLLTGILRAFLKIFLYSGIPNGAFDMLTNKNLYPSVNLSVFVNVVTTKYFVLSLFSNSAMQCLEVNVNILFLNTHLH